LVRHYGQAMRCLSSNCARLRDYASASAVSVRALVPQVKLTVGEDRENCRLSSAPRDCRRDTGSLHYSRIYRSRCPKGTASA
jgi:hypothetical protein